MEELTLNRMLRSIDKQKTRIIKAKAIINYQRPAQCFTKRKH